MRHWKTGIGVVAALAASAGAFSAIRNNGAGGAARAATAPPAFVMPVPVVSVVKKPVPVYREYTARTEAIRTISILPRISGYIQKQDTPDGSDVHEGDLLYIIDPRDVQAALDQVKAQMQRDKAALEYARSNLNRGAALVGNGFLAKDVRGNDQEHHSGELTFLDNYVDRSTGTIIARATIANLDHSILPGQYVHVRISLHEIPNALIVPQAAIGSSQLGKYVYVVNPESKVEQRLVSLGPTDGDGVVIASGVAEGDSIITGNLQKIGPGAAVKPQLAPKLVAGPP
jgi:multidrug efflux pump subunit AcrA (membrane-fusion protein)